MIERWYRLDRKGSLNAPVGIAINIIWLPESEAKQYAKYPDLYTIEPVVIMTQAEYDALVEQPDAPAVPSEVREAIAWALSWAKNDSREIRLHSTAMEHQAIMASIDMALAWLAALGQETANE